jgi:hypothetical protein
LAALVAGGRRLLRRRDNDHPSHFHVMLRTTPTAIELLPEVEASPTTGEGADGNSDGNAGGDAGPRASDAARAN